MPLTTHDSAHGHAHGHTHAPPREPRLRASWLRASAAQRLLGAAVVLALLWLAVFWALS